MDSSYDLSIRSYEDLSRNSSYIKGDISISDEILDFQRLRISALTKAAEISPDVKEVTIGPNTPTKKQPINDKPTIINNDNNDENLIEDKVREDLRYTLIQKRHENRMNELSGEFFRDLCQNMLSTRASFMTEFSKKQSELCEKKSLELRKQKLQLIKALRDNDNTTVLEKARLDEQNSKVIQTQTIENVNRILEEQNRATARFASIIDSDTKIYSCCNDITNILCTEPLAKPICDKYTTNIQAIVSHISHIRDIYKTGSVNDKDVQQAEELSQKMENIKMKIIEDIEKIKQEELLKKQKQEELKKKEQEEKERRTQEELDKAAQIAESEKAKATLQAQRSKTKPVFYSNKNYNYYEELKNYLENYEAQYKELLQDVNLKKFRFDCQKAVNTPVNALSSVSALHMRDKFDKLTKLLKGETVKVLDIHVTATQHPQGLYYCTALLAKKIVRQGDLLVSSNVEAAYPLAAVTAALWSQFPHFGKLVEANFHRFCPYLVPMFLPQKEGQTDKDFYLSRGYTYNDEGVVEKQDKFLKRMSGIFRLRCAIWIAQMPKFLNTPNPNGLYFGWQWLSSFLNLKPEPDISATCLHDFFIMCGSTFDKHYGRQFRKIIELAFTQYLKILDNIDEGGPKTRLEVYLQNVLKTNDVPAPPASTQQINW